MRYTASTPTLALLLAVGLAAPPSARAQQDSPVDLSGNVSVGYVRSSDSAEAPADGTALEPGVFRQADFALDLHAGTFILDPRFLTVATDVRFSTLRSTVADVENDNSLNGQTYSVNFLPASRYPFRFMYSRNNGDFTTQGVPSFATNTRNLQWDWRLRMPSLPELSVAYDSRSDRSGSVTGPDLPTDSSGLSIIAKDTLKGWDVRGSFDRRSSLYGVTGLDSLLSTGRVDVERKFTPDSELSIRGLRQTNSYEPLPGIPGQSFEFINIRTEYLARLNNRLGVQAYHQYYSNSAEVRLTEPAAATGLSGPVAEARELPAGSAFAGGEGPDGGLFAPRPDGAPAVTAGGTGMFGPLAAAEPAAETERAVRVSTTTNGFGGGVGYAILPSLSVNASAGFTSIAPPTQLVESATSIVNAQAGFGWSRHAGVVGMRADASYGLSSIRSNVGERNLARHYTASGGLTVGSGAVALGWVDATFTHTDDMLQMNGYARETSYSGGVEFQVLRGLRITGSAGAGELETLSTDGQQHYQRRNASFGLEHRLFTAQVSRHMTEGDRDIYSVPFEVTPLDYFLLLPVDTLIPDPLQNTRSVFDQATVRLRLARDLDLEGRYLRNVSEFERAADSTSTDLEVLAAYRLGKFTFRAGALLQHVDVENGLERRRNQYFFRVSRAFRIL